MITTDNTTANANNPSALRLFFDSADVRQWENWLPSGLFYGVTTNPLLLQKAQVPCRPAALEVLAGQAFTHGIHEIQLQTWGTTKAQQIDTAFALAAIDSRVVIKVPVTRTGTEVAACLINEGIRVTLTGVCAPHQVLTAAALGADYAAPYLGRINDMGRNGRQDLTDMKRAVSGVRSPCRVLTASIRSIDDITELTVRGLDTFTFSEGIAAEWFNVPATEQAAADFEAAAQGQ
jgi:transaldolase